MLSAETSRARLRSRNLGSRCLAAATLVAISLAVSGCIRPLYGPSTASTQGSSVREALAAIDVPMIPDRLGHTMRNELVFLLEGRDNPGPKRYRLLVATNEGLSSALINSQFQRAETGTLNGSASYRLTALDNPANVIASGSITGFASFENTPQRFANLRAIREAQQRLAKYLAEQIHLQLATKLTASGI
jgi:LPS-assembly lipoprotein